MLEQHHGQMIEHLDERTVDLELKFDRIEAVLRMLLATPSAVSMDAALAARCLNTLDDKPEPATA